MSKTHHSSLAYSVCMPAIKTIGADIGGLLYPALHIHTHAWMWSCPADINLGINLMLQ